MSVKLVLLKSGEQLISDAKELVQDEVVHGYPLNKPHKAATQKALFLTEENEAPDDNVEIVFSPWILLSSDDNIVVPKDWVVTIVEPLSLYLKCIRKNIAVKCLLVDVDNVLISEVVEVDELGDPNCRLIIHIVSLVKVIELYQKQQIKGTDDSVRRHSDYRRSTQKLLSI